MGKRPSREELVARAFPELRQSGAGLGDKEAAIGINTRAAEAILGDLIGLYDAGYSAKGPGVLAVRLNKEAVSQNSDYLTADDIKQDYELASRLGDEGIASKMSEITSLLDSHNAAKAALLMLIDSGMRVFQIPRDNPASALTAMMEALQR